MPPRFPDPDEPHPEVHPVPIEVVLEKLRELCANANERERKEAEERAAYQTEHPDAPHASWEWRSRSQIVFSRMKRHLAAEHAPWHHREIYEWARDTPEGQAWLEKEIVYWERMVFDSYRIRVRARMSREFVVETPSQREDDDDNF